MKNSAAIFGFSITLLLGVVSASSAPIVTPSLSIAAQPSMVKSGEDIRVNINIANGSNKPLSLVRTVGKGTAEFSYAIKVTRQDNLPVNRTDYGLSLVGAGTIALRTSNRLLDLPPGQSYTDYFLLNKIYDVSRPGVYTVQIQQKLTAGMTVAAHSNSIKVVVQ